MVGRGPELAAIAALIDQARAGVSGVLVISGDAGIGKTTLLEHAAGTEGIGVLWTRGVASESALGHAGLLELLSPLQDLLEQVPDGQAAALAAALGWASATEPPAPLLVAAGTLSLISAASATEPLLVVVDDLHWLDHASATALLFAVRRMRDDPVAFLLATRPGPQPTDLPTVELAGLDAGAIRTCWPELAPAVSERLAQDAGGNPLVLAELVPRLTAAQSAGAAPLPAPVPIGPRVSGLFTDRLAALSPDAARLVLLHACAEGDDSGVVAAAARAEAIPLEAATDEALRLHVLDRVDGHTGLAHPLLRSTVLTGAEPAALRAAYASLATAAESLAPTAWLWYRAAATEGHDDTLARELAQLAETSRRELGSAVASAALERAAALTDRPDVAAAWLAAAASDALLAGDLERTRNLAGRVTAGTAPQRARAEALFVLGMTEEYAGSVPRAAALLAEAVPLAEGILAVRILAELATIRFRLGDMTGVAACARDIEPLADLDDPYQRMLARFVVGFASLVAGDPATARPHLEDALALVSSRRITDSQALLVYQAIEFAGDLEQAMGVAAARLEEIRADGLGGLLVSALAMWSSLCTWMGDHAGAFAAAGEAAELADHLGYAADAASAHEIVAWQSAARGLHDTAAESLAQSERLLARAGLTEVAAHHALNAAFCALCRDDAPAVVSILRPRLDIDGGMGWLGESLGVAPLLIEALVVLGKVDEARALAVRVHEALPEDAPAQTRAGALRCRALTASEPDEAREAFEASLSAYDEAFAVFEAARGRLLLGSWLRRRGERRAARELLAQAGSAFARMELTAWVAKTQAELGATGARARPRSEVLHDEPLTSQETRVALLVAQGHSNKDIAALLFLSPRTVETHLSSVYRKRGVRTRTQLAAAFLGEGASTVEP